jgi:hypothetical protein
MLKRLTVLPALLILIVVASFNNVVNTLQYAVMGKASWVLEITDKTIRSYWLKLQTWSHDNE